MKNNEERLSLPEMMEQNECGEMFRVIPLPIGGGSLALVQPRNGAGGTFSHQAVLLWVRDLVPTLCHVHLAIGDKSRQAFSVACVCPRCVATFQSSENHISDEEALSLFAKALEGLCLAQGINTVIAVGVHDLAPVSQMEIIEARGNEIGIERLFEAVLLWQQQESQQEKIAV